MKEKIREQLKKLPQNFVVGFLIKSDNYENANLHLVDILLNEMKHHGGYINITRPYKNLVKRMDSMKIDHSQIFFIDCITKHLGGAENGEDNCLYLESPTNLTDLSIAIHEYIKAGQGHVKFIILDSISSLHVYNDTDRLMKFLHYLTGKMRLWDLNGIMLTIHEDTDKEIVEKLSQFCDKLIRIK